MYLSRRALAMALEHLNLHPVRTKNVPIFCPKGDVAIYRQSGESGAAAIGKTIADNKF